MSSTARLVVPTAHKDTRGVGAVSPANPVDVSVIKTQESTSTAVTVWFVQHVTALSVSVSAKKNQKISVYPLERIAYI